MKPKQIINNGKFLSGLNKKEHHSIMNTVIASCKTKNENSRNYNNVFFYVFGCNPSPLNRA